MRATAEYGRHDLVVSSIHMKKPQYPCRWHSQLLRHQPAPSDTNTPELSSLLDDEPQVVVLTHMCRLLSEIARLKDAGASDEESKDVNVACNEVQYLILALPESSFRIAAMLFSDIFFFKSPVATGTQEKLAHVLHGWLKTCTTTGLLGLWMATVGGLAVAAPVEARDFLIQFAAGQAARLGISNIESFRCRLSEVLLDNHVLQGQLEPIWNHMRYTV